jgi:hypothetical protein
LGEQLKGDAHENRGSWLIGRGGWWGCSFVGFQAQSRRKGRDPTGPPLVSIDGNQHGRTTDHFQVGFIQYLKNKYQRIKMNAMSHSLQLFESLTQIGVQPDVAHHVEREIQNGIHRMHEQSLGDKLDRFVTKDEFRVESNKLRLELHAEINKLRQEMHAEINKLRQEMHAEINKLRQELHASSWRQIGFNFAFFSVAVAILKYAP